MFTYIFAGLRAPVADDAGGAASAGGDGSGADVTGSQGEADDSRSDWATMLAGHTVAAQLGAVGKGEGQAAEPARGPKGKPDGAALEKPKDKPRSRKAGGTEAEADEADDAEGDEQERGRVTGAILPEDDADSEDEAEADGATGADDGEGGDDNDDDEEEGAAADDKTQKKLKALEKDNFSTRQKLRESKAALKEREERIAVLEKQVAEKGGGAGGASLNGLPAGFEHVKGAADLDTMEAQMQQGLDWAEDHAEGYTGKGEGGAEVEYTPQQMRQYRRQMQQGLKQVEKAREMLRKRGEREKAATDQAKVKYPFVTDAGSPHAALVRQLEEEHPEVGQSPERALLLGRLTVARLIEDGTYEITRKASKPKGKNEGRPEGRPTSSLKTTPPSPPPARRKAGEAAVTAEEADWALSLARQTMPG